MTARERGKVRVLGSPLAETVWRRVARVDTRGVVLLTALAKEEMLFDWRGVQVSGPAAFGATIHPGDLAALRRTTVGNAAEMSK